MMCIDTITALGLQYVFVRKAGRFIGEFASVVITFRERNRLLSHGQLSWSFVDELGFELAPRHPWLLNFLKSPKCVFSDGSTYNSWKTAAGVTAAGCHELVITPNFALRWSDSSIVILTPMLKVAYCQTCGYFISQNALFLCLLVLEEMIETYN